ncbi:MAG TPA: type II secretion system F family protein [Pedococcus sp.]|nr:type II secretion system F family protein [Pedococcus sp.]
MLGAVAMLAVAILVWPSDPELPRQPGRVVSVRRGILRISGWEGQRVRTLAELADLLALMSAPIRIGVPPATAVRVAIESAPGAGPLRRVYDDLVRNVEAGESLSDVWLLHADALGSGDLRLVGQAWRLTELTGAPLAGALIAAEEVLRGRERSRLSLAAAVAGPRASMAVLALLPLCGPFVGVAFGIGPRELYFSSAAATASLAMGVATGLLAWVWSRSIVHRALIPRPSRHRRR